MTRAEWDATVEAEIARTSVLFLTMSVIVLGMELERAASVDRRMSAMARLIGATVWKTFAAPESASRDQLLGEYYALGKAAVLDAKMPPPESTH